MPRTYNPQKDIVAGRTASQIEGAKRKAVGGSRKRCRKGKSCSATCIASYKVCLVDIPWVAAKGLGNLRDNLQSLSANRTSLSSIAPLTERGQSRMSLEKERANFNKLLELYKRQAGASNLNNLQDREKLKDLLLAKRKVIQREGSDPDIKRRKEKLDREDPAFATINARIKSAERSIRIQEEIISMQEKKLAAAPKGSEREKYLKDRISQAKGAISNLERDLKKAEKEKRSFTGGLKPATNLSNRSNLAISQLTEVLENVNNASQPIKVKGTESADNVNWKAAISSGARRLGEPGAYGAFISVPQENLFKAGIRGNYPNGVGVKGGQIGAEEAAAIKKAGEANLGPKLVSAKINPTIISDSMEPGIRVYNSGLIAMGIVPGKDAQNFFSHSSTTNGVTVSSAFWKARADLHRLGIAHQDMHPGNVIIDDKGKARFVDFGLATMNPRAVLAEAIGGATKSDFQIGRWGIWGTKTQDQSPEYVRLVRNWRKVQSEMRRDGLSDAAIRYLANTGIRVEPDKLNTGDGWKDPALTDRNIQKYIGMLYEGF